MFFTFWRAIENFTLTAETLTKPETLLDDLCMKW